MLHLDFIQQKCLILPEDIDHTWKSIINSMNQFPYDAVKYSNKPKQEDNSLTAPVVPSTINDNEKQESTTMQDSIDATD